MSHYEYALALVMLAVTISTFGLLSLLYNAHWKVASKYSYVQISLTLGDLSSLSVITLTWHLYLDGRIQMVQGGEHVPGLWIIIPDDQRSAICRKRVDSLSTFKHEVEALASKMDLDGLKQMGCQVTIFDPKESKVLNEQAA